MKNLKIATGFKLPAKVATEKSGFIGTTGSGKTYGSSKLAEQFWYEGSPFVVLDPVGVWYGLRLAKNGKNPSGIDIPIFGGLHGDIPLESGSGALIADLIIDKNLSAVLDVSQFESDTEKARFALGFSDRFFFRKKASPSAVTLILEEVQEFVPQNPQRGEEKMLHSFVRMQKLGRNFGIGSIYITQRPQEVNKKALNMVQTLFVFRTTGTHERTAIEKWIEDKSLDQNIAQDLPKLATGTCHVWSPEFLKISETVKISEKDTFDASATPEVGKKAHAVKLTDIDLAALQDQMAATIEKAKQDDPQILRKRIFELEKQVKNGLTTIAVSKTAGIKEIFKSDPKAIEAAVNSALRRREVEFEKERKSTRGMITGYIRAFKNIEQALVLAGNSSDIIRQAPDLPPAPAFVSVPLVDQNIQQHASSGIPDYTSDGITGPEQRVLNAIAWMENVGIQDPVGEIVAFLSGYGHVLSKGFTVPRGALKTRNLITYPTPGRISLTDEGKKLAQYPEGIGSTQELHQRVLERLDGPKQRLLKPLLAVHPNDMAAEELCVAAGYSHPLSKGFTVPRGKLKTFGLITYPTPGRIRAAEVLFID